MTSEAPLATRQIKFLGKDRTIAGISAEDPYFSGLHDDYEWPFKHFCRRYIREGYNCVDIGANIGLMSMYISEFCRPGRVVSAEPNRRVFSALQRNLATNGAHNVTPFNVALNERDGDIRFQENSAYGRVDERGDAVIEGVTFSTLLQRAGLDRVDFVKIDVEGFEPVVLRSALDQLRIHKPLIFMEFNTWALLSGTRTEPLGFMEWILNTFAMVHVVQPDSPDLLRRVTIDEVESFIEDNIFKHGSLNDLVITDDPERMAYSAAYLDARFNELQLENTFLKNERNSSPWNQAKWMVEKAAARLKKP